MTELISALRAPTADVGTGHVATGSAVSRIDGRAKVTGEAQYAAEHFAADMLYGVVVSSTIAKGRILDIDTEAAMAEDGVVAVMSHLNRPKLRSFGIAYKDMTAPAGAPFRPLFDGFVLYSGQPIGLVLASTFEAARRAAALVRVRYEAVEHDTRLTANLARAYQPSAAKAGYEPPPPEKGSASNAFAAAPVKIEAHFHHGAEHHNPLELFASTVIRADDGHLTIYDKTQSSQNSRWYVSHVFGLAKRMVTVRNTYVGGAFGSGLRPQYQLPLAVMASLHLKRSVRVQLTRQQMFSFGHRPETVQTVKLAADHDGKLRAIMHEATGATSKFEDYVEAVVNWSGVLYACDNIRLGYKLVKLDQYTPIDMRAPGAAHGMHALEVAMDELSYALNMDPLALRLKNYAERCPIDDKPYSSKELRACYAQGAEQFGWSRRPMAPRARREGTELVGWGMATGVWDALQMFARASAVLHADGRLVVSSAATDIGTGTYTVMAMIAAENLGLPLERVTFQLGDSTLPVAPVEGGSSHVATVGSAVAGVCDKLRLTLLRHAQTPAESPFRNKRLKDVVFAKGVMCLKSDPGTCIALEAILVQAGRDKLEEKYLMLPRVLKQRKFRRLVHSAVFVEVRVDEELGIVRVARVVSAVAAGRIMNTRTAASQIVGGVVWGISQALHEESLTDHRFGRFMNHNLSEYHVAVNADIPDIDVIFVAEDDRVVSRLGAKGVGEIGLVSVAAAVSNAIFHATGKRVRNTPVTPAAMLNV